MLNLRIYKTIPKHFLIFAIMKDEIKDTKNFLMDISDGINDFYALYFSGSSAWIFQVATKILVLVGLFFLIDFSLKFIIRLIKRFVKKEKFPFVHALFESKFLNSLAHIFALSICSFAMYSLFYGKYMHPATREVLLKIVDILQVVVIAGAAIRLYKSLEIYFTSIGDTYKLMAFRAISQTLKIFGTVVFFFIAIKIIFSINATTILGSLGAITAVLVLVFRDTILGFVTGIHVATSKNMKVGDWIGIPKYNIEGNISNIDLLTTKIINFDKTVSTIPTYDLMSTEIRNYQVMTEGNLRRIKRSMLFNIKSFHFLSDEDIERFKKINYLSDYLNHKEVEIKVQRSNLKNSENILNGQQLTNIGVFRKYVENYLKNNPNIEQKEIILVRQLEITSQGMPLEIYCFTIFSGLEDYERVQSDIFDHLLVAAQDFGLEIMQINKI